MNLLNFEPVKEATLQTIEMCERRLHYLLGYISKKL